MKSGKPFRGQMSETASRAAVFIILSGGFQDAYTYTCRGEVFANAQTGNIVLLSTALYGREWQTVLKISRSGVFLCGGSRRLPSLFI